MHNTNVNHRVGGLEVTPIGTRIERRVNHRVGGLEELMKNQIAKEIVNHRVGGLEVFASMDEQP